MKKFDFKLFTVIVLILAALCIMIISLSLTQCSITNGGITDRSDYMQVWLDTPQSVMVSVDVPNNWFKININGFTAIETYAHNGQCDSMRFPRNILPSGELKFELISDHIYEVDYLQ